MLRLCCSRVEEQAWADPHALAERLSVYDSLMCIQPNLIGDHFSIIIVFTITGCLASAYRVRNAFATSKAPSWRV